MTEWPGRPVSGPPRGSAEELLRRGRYELERARATLAEMAQSQDPAVRARIPEYAREISQQARAFEASVREMQNPTMSQRQGGRRVRTPVEEGVRQVNRAEGMIAGGMGGLVGLVANPLNEALNMTGIPEAISGERAPTDYARLFRDWADAPEPETATERVTDLVGESLASSGPVLGLARNLAARGASELTRRVSALAAEPWSEAAGSAGAGLAQGLAAEAGAGPVGQTFAALAGGFGAGTPGAVADTVIAAPTSARQALRQRVEERLGIRRQPVVPTPLPGQVDPLGQAGRPDVEPEQPSPYRSSSLTGGGGFEARPDAQPPGTSRGTVVAEGIRADLENPAGPRPAEASASPESVDTPPRMSEETPQPPEEPILSPKEQDLVNRYAAAFAEGGDPPPPPRPPDPTPREPGDPDPTPPRDIATLVSTLTRKIETGARLNKANAEAQTAERARRLAIARGVAEGGLTGEARHRAMLSALKGPLPRAEFSPASAGFAFTREEIVMLYDHVKANHEASGSRSIYDLINAQTALTDLLEGTVPTNSNLDALRRVFDYPDLINALKKHRHDSVNWMINLGNFPRSIMSSYDLSAPLRQGVFMIHRPEFWRSFWGMSKNLRSEENFQSMMTEIRSRPTYELMEEYRLAITDLGSDPHNREDAFNSEWAERVHGVRASGRGFTGFLVKLRADVFDSILRKWDEQGFDYRNNPQALRQLTRHINAATGRGDLGSVQKYAPALSATFFSPHLVASRLQLLNPVYYLRLHPMVRREAVKDLVSYMGYVSSVLGMLYMSGVDVGLDPGSSDFLKIRIGNERYDITGGFASYLTLAYRLVAAVTTDNERGTSREVGSGRNQVSRARLIGRFLRYKLAPVPGLGLDYLWGSDALGNEFNLQSGLGSRMLPLFIQDLADIYGVELTREGLVRTERSPQTVGEAATRLGPAALAFFGGTVNDIPVRNRIDEYGRPVEVNPMPPETDPAVIEIERLLGRPLSRPRPEITIDGVSRRLTDEEFDRYVQVSGGYIVQSVRELMASPEFERMDDAERRREIDGIIRDMRANAREDVFESRSGVARLGASAPQQASEEDWPGTPVSESPLQAPQEPAEGQSGSEWPGTPVSSAQPIVEALFPGIVVTENVRDPNSPLGRANPGSWHNRSEQAVDVRPIPGMTFREFITRIRQSGFRVIESRDEVRNPTRHATGPHWHVVIEVPRG